MKFNLGNYEINMVHHDPVVFTVDGILSNEECAHFRKVARQNMRRSKVSGFDKEKNKRGLLDKRRTSSNCWVSHKHDQVTLRVGERIAELVQMPLSHAESFQILHYSDNQEYQAHLDTFDPEIKEYSHYLKNGGQRIITALAYLNGVKQGGETSFPNINKTVKAEKGKVVVFHDCYKGTNKAHPDSLHGALPVEQGEKWAFNLWFREKPVKHKI